jgi:hypothetical protein
MSSSFVSDDWEFLYHAETLSYTAERMLGTNTNGHTTGGSYRPIVNVYWGTMFELFGTWVVPYRISILLLQILAIVLVYHVVRRLPIVSDHTETLALIAAACFALFPGRVEALSWIAVINDTLLVPLLLISWLCYIVYLQKKQGYIFILSILCFLLAIGTKEVAVTFPAILAGTYILFAIREECKLSVQYAWKHVVRLVAHMIPYALVLLLFFVIRYHIIGFVTEDYTGAGFSLLQNNPIRAYISMFFGIVLVDPARTSVSLLIYQYQAIGGVILLYIVGMMSVLSKARHITIAVIVLSWYALAVFPASRFGVNMWQVVPSAEGERYTYYPSIFLAILIATFGVAVWRRYKIHTYVRVLGICCIIGYVGYATVGTIQKVQYWKIASETSDALFASFLTEQLSAQYDAVVLIGLPDALYGAFIWRNAFGLMVSHNSTTQLSFDDILTTPIRTLPTLGVDTTIREVDGSIWYEATAPIITSAPEVDTDDYNAVHGESRYREPLSISYTDFTNGILFTPSPSFRSNNVDKRVGLFFFDGNMEWHHTVLREDTSLVQ